MSNEGWERQKAEMEIARDGEIKAFARFIGLEHNLQVSEWLLRLDERVRRLEGERAAASMIAMADIPTAMPNLFEHVLCVSHDGQVCETCGKPMKSKSGAA